MHQVGQVNTGVGCSSVVCLACAVDDEWTATVGDPVALALALNDEVLTDEADETADLVYSLVDAPAGYTIDEETGVLTFTATESITLTYAVVRLGTELSSLADVFITVLACRPRRSLEYPLSVLSRALRHQRSSRTRTKSARRRGR